MARRNAKKLYQEIVREAQSRGGSIHDDGSGRSLANRIGLADLQTFANISEACGVDRDGHPLSESWGPETDMRLREGKYDPDQEYTIPVRRAKESLADFSIRDLYENLVCSRSNGEPVGAGYVRQNMQPGDAHGARRIYEADTVGAVDSSLFYGITGQLLISAVLNRFIQEAFVVTNLCGRYPTRMVHGERIPGVGLLADPDKNNIESITLAREGDPVKFIGMQEEYIELPETEKHQLGIQITRETIYEDRTGLVLSHAGEIGNILGLRKEKRLIGVVIGGTTNPCYFKEKRAFDKIPMTLDLYQYEVNGSAAYQLNSSATNWNGSTANSSRPYPFYNDVPNNPLHDYTAFRTADQYFSKVVDPNTGEPVEVGRPFVLLPYTRRWDLVQIVQAQALFKMSQAAGATGTFSNANLITQTPASALSGLMAQQFASSRQLRAQMILQLGLADADVDWVWFNGDFGEAIKYTENWPLTVVQAPPQNEAEFMQDIVARFKASEKGVPAIWNPRVVQRHNYQSEVSGS